MELSCFYKTVKIGNKIHLQSQFARLTLLAIGSMFETPTLSLDTRGGQVWQDMVATWQCMVHSLQFAVWQCSGVWFYQNNIVCITSVCLLLWQ